MLIQLAIGSLPWQGVAGTTKLEKYASILDLKFQTNEDILCRDLPEAFSRFLRSVKLLEYEEKPDYKKYREDFRALWSSFSQNNVMANSQPYLKLNIITEPAQPNFFDWQLNHCQNQGKRRSTARKSLNIQITPLTTPSVAPEQKAPLITDLNQANISSEVVGVGNTQEICLGLNTAEINLKSIENNMLQNNPTSKLIDPGSQTTPGLGMQFTRTGGGAATTVDNSNNNNIKIDPSMKGTVGESGGQPAHNKAHESQQQNGPRQAVTAEPVHEEQSDDEEEECKIPILFNNFEGFKD